MANPGYDDDVLQQTVDVFEELGGQPGKSARRLECDVKTLKRRLDAAARRGIVSTLKTIETAQGWNPEHDLNKVVPRPLVLRGTSTLYGDDGALKLQWVKTKLDDSRFEEVLRAAVAARRARRTASSAFIAPLVLGRSKYCSASMKSRMLAKGSRWPVRDGPASGTTACCRSPCRC